MTSQQDCIWDSGICSSPVHVFSRPFSPCRQNHGATLSPFFAGVQSKAASVPREEEKAGIVGYAETACLKSMFHHRP